MTDPSYDPFNQHVDNLLRAMRLCLDEKLFIPALMLLYATVDGLAWCVRANRDGDVTGRDFIQWVETYGDLSVYGPEFPSWVYGARCALLHSQTAESDLSRRGKVPEIWYQLGEDGSQLIPLGADMPRMSAMVPVQTYFRWFEDAVTRFRAAVAADATLRERVHTEAMKHLRPAMTLQQFHRLS